MKVHFFKSSTVWWKPGIHLKLARWHSCEKWGWPSIRAGEHLEMYSDYFVFHICWRGRGMVWHFYPKFMTDIRD